MFKLKVNILKLRDGNNIPEIQYLAIVNYNTIPFEQVV